MLLDRTFHPDEANQAFTVGHLLETGHYTYKPTDHHGPTLYYAAAPLQKAFGHNDTASLDGTLLRCTPLIFAVLSLVFLFLALRRLLSKGASDSVASQHAWTVPLLSVLLVGTAPLFVFFATDFIQEMLLVCFTTMMLWSGIGYFTPSGRLKPGSWALIFGISTGLAFATKETSVLTFAAVVLSAIPFLWRALKSDNRTIGLSNNPVLTHLVLALLAFVLTSVILFSSFCENWQGISNAFIAAPLSYLHRATGDVASEGASWHVHPWWKYLQWLLIGVNPLPRTYGFTIETNAFANLHPLTHLLFLALPVGIFSLCRDKWAKASILLRAFLTSALYTLILLALYSAIPYKTPWCTLQILVPFLVTAALGYGVLREILTDFAIRRGVNPATASRALGLVFLIVLPLVTISTEHIPGLLLMNRDPDSPKIPYNYAHASPEAQQLAACVATAVEAASSSYPGQSNTQPIEHSNNSPSFIAVALPPADTWPFPWYNRALEHITGYWTKFEDLVELEKTGAKPTVVIVPMTEGHLVQPLFPHLKHTKRFYMRPGVRVRVFW